MAYQGVVSPAQLTESFNNVHFDAKAAIRMSQNQIGELITELGDPDKDLIIDGRRFKGADKFGAAATLALNNKMEQLSSSTTTIISVFSELYRLERQLGGQTS